MAKIKWRFPGYVWLISMLGSAGMISCFLIGHLLDFQLPDFLSRPLEFIFGALVLACCICFILTPFILFFRLFGVLFNFSRNSMLIWLWSLAFWAGTIFLLGHIPPNMRSRVARVRGDLRCFSGILEEYFKDHQTYPDWTLDSRVNAFSQPKKHGEPPTAPAPPGIPSFTLAHATRRPTLVSGHYVSHYLWDALSPVKEAPFAYWTNADRTTSATVFLLWSAGPDGRYDITIDNVAEVMSPRLPAPSPALINLAYDPSNGAWSRGDIYRYKGY